ncbi:MAG TPA: signal peptide peptidase SppA [Verrucomicrobiae bacterium]|nr:signal peptide peptidase SppA [Verrucomicrobiae bacterium]
MPSAQRPSGGGRGWMVLAIVLLVLLAVCGAFIVAAVAGSVMLGHGSYARTAGPRLDEVQLEDNGSANKIAVIEVNGIISSGGLDQSGNGMVETIRAELRRAQEDDKVKAVILRVDSPGGEVMAADEIHHALVAFQKHKPIVASMGSLAASGGYYVSAPCRWIVANDLTITGSIGVILSSWNYRGLMDKLGLAPETFKSGKFKDMLSGSREPDSITPEEKQMVQELIDQTFSRFKAVVQEGRAAAHRLNKNEGRALAPGWVDYADGRVLSGTDAYKLGFVDELGYFKEAVSRAKSIADIPDANLVEYEEHHDLTDLLRLFGKSDAKPITVDLGMGLPRLQAGRLYFLSPTYLH